MIGASLGGAAALLGRVPVDALVLEAVCPDIIAAFEDRLRVRLGKLAGTALVPILTPAFRAAIPWLLGTTADALRPIDQIATIGGPVLNLSGTEDRYTPLAETRALYDQAAQPKQAWFVRARAMSTLSTTTRRGIGRSWCRSWKRRFSSGTTLLRPVLSTAARPWPTTRKAARLRPQSSPSPAPIATPPGPPRQPGAWSR